MVSSSFAPFVGGVEEHVRQVAHSLAQEGCRVEVWTVDRGTGDAVERDGAVVIRRMATPLPSGSVRGVAHFGTRVARAWHVWVEAYRGLRPEVIHIHCFGPNGVYGWLLHRRFRVPLVVTSHGETLADDNRVFDRSAVLTRSLRRAISASGAVTAPSEFVLEDLRRRFGLTRGVVVPNGVDLSIEPSPRNPERRFFFAVGRLGAMKGFDLLLDAFARAGLDDDISLVIGGDGPERDVLTERIVAAGLGDRIELRGWMDRQQIADAMAGALAVVVPSRMEAFGIVALEAWRSGAALIMTDRGGGPGFVTDGLDGLLVDPTDVDALADALERVATQPTLRKRLGEGGAAAVGSYSWSRVADAYTALYEDQLRR